MIWKIEVCNSSTEQSKYTLIVQLTLPISWEESGDIVYFHHQYQACLIRPGAIINVHEKSAGPGGWPI